ncbi:MAG: LacI family transcriptional regulator [Treponema sp.]|nr:LacI family transcriptional regulator [Treponema sp.]
MKKKATMKDIADVLGISVNAVSLALNNRKGISEDLRLKVFEVARVHGYLDLNTRFTSAFERYTFCVMLQGIYAHDSFYGKILYAVEKAARNNNYNILLYHFNDENMSVPDCVEKHYVSSIIILGKILSRNIDLLMSFHLNIIVIDHSPMRSHINCVLTDNMGGGSIATRYLIRAGFRRVGFFGDLSYSLSVKQRYYGFLEALHNEGLVSLNEQAEYVRRYSITGEIERYIIEHNTDAIAALLPSKFELPQAYFCSNDSAAIVLINALHKKGIQVPQEVSIIGFDNIDLAEKIEPKLTTINVNHELMGYKAVYRLIQMKNGQNEGVEHTVLGVELVERASVALDHYKNNH